MAPTSRQNYGALSPAVPILWPWVCGWQAVFSSFDPRLIHTFDTNVRGVMCSVLLEGLLQRGPTATVICTRISRNQSVKTKSLAKELERRIYNWSAHLQVLFEIS